MINGTSTKVVVDILCNDFISISWLPGNIMTSWLLDLNFTKNRRPCFYTTKVMAFHDCLCFCMFFLEILKNGTTFFGVVLIFTIFAHPTLGGTPSPRARRKLDWWWTNRNEYNPLPAREEKTVRHSQECLRYFRPPSCARKRGGIHLQWA